MEKKKREKPDPQTIRYYQNRNAMLQAMLVENQHKLATTKSKLKVAREIKTLLKDDSDPLDEVFWCSREIQQRRLRVEEYKITSEKLLKWAWKLRAGVDEGLTQYRPRMKRAARLIELLGETKRLWDAKIGDARREGIDAPEEEEEEEEGGKEYDTD